MVGSGDGGGLTVRHSMQFGPEWFAETQNPHIGGAE